MSEQDKSNTYIRADIANQEKLEYGKRVGESWMKECEYLEGENARLNNALEQAIDAGCLRIMTVPIDEKSASLWRYRGDEIIVGTGYSEVFFGGFVSDSQELASHIKQSSTNTTPNVV